MPTPEHESKAEYIRRMADDGAGGLGTPTEVGDNIIESFEDIVNVVTDLGDLPATASIRPNGVFSDASDMHEYLESGGLVVADDSGNAVPIGFVWAIKFYDDILNQEMWGVYIERDTP